MSRLSSSKTATSISTFANKKAIKTPLKTSSSCNFCGTESNLPQSSKSSDNSSQTTDVNDEYFLKDAIIRFPSACNISRREEEGKREFSLKVNVATSPEKENTNLGGSIRPNVDQLSLNIQSNSPPNPKTFTTTAKDRDSRSKLSEPHKPGEIPKYLVQRKKELARDEAIAEGPPGHYLLTDKERMEALHMAEKKYEALIKELNQLPITAQTIRVRSRKIEIEKDLASLEGTIRVFSRNKVFVNVNE